jgi:hypothetical protein
VQRLTTSLGLAWLFTTGACPPPQKTPETTPDGAAEASPSARSYLLGGRAEGYDIAAAIRRVVDPSRLGDGLGPGGTDLAEAVVVPLDMFGIPWEHFTIDAPSDLPGPWVAAMQDAAAKAKALDRPIAIALSPLNQRFDNIAELAHDQDGNGVLDLDQGWQTQECYDPGTDGNPTKWRDAYARYAVWVADLFDPRWVVVAQRLNLFEARCGKEAPNAYPAYVGYAAAAHQRLKALPKPPTTVVGVDVEDLYGLPPVEGRCAGNLGTPECLAGRVALLRDLAADRLGLESYPAQALANQAIETLPKDWLDRVVASRPDLPSLVIGTGLPARTVESPSNVCVPLLVSSEDIQTAWLDQVLATAEKRAMELVVWSTLKDQLDGAVVASCPCSGDTAICQHLSLLGADRDRVRLETIRGLTGDDGTDERLGLKVWRSLLPPPPACAEEGAESPDADAASQCEVDSQ